VTEQLELLPEHDPPQRSKRRFLSGIALKVTFVPEEKRAVHCPGHEIPAGELATAPPASARTVSLAVVGEGEGGAAGGGGGDPPPEPPDPPGPPDRGSPEPPEPAPPKPPVGGFTLRFSQFSMWSNGSRMI
jgi:hypothetical protein